MNDITRTTSDIVAKLWNLCHILRDDGITYNEYVTELTFLLFLKMLQGFLCLLQDIFSPGEQFGTEILALPLVHERLLVRGPIIFDLRQHSTYSLSFSGSWLRLPTLSGRLIYVRSPTDNIPLHQAGAVLWRQLKGFEVSSAGESC